MMTREQKKNRRQAKKALGRLIVALRGRPAPFRERTPEERARLEQEQDMRYLKAQGFVKRW